MENYTHNPSVNIRNIFTTLEMNMQVDFEKIPTGSSNVLISTLELNGGFFSESTCTFGVYVGNKFCFEFFS